MKKINFLSLTVVLFLVSQMAAQEPVRWDYIEEAVYDNPDNKPSGHANIIKGQAKELKKYADDFVFIEGGPTAMGSNLIGSFTEADSTLLTMSDLWRRVTVYPFFMCNHEVTNAEYRAFVDWVKIRKAYQLLAEAYPANYLRADGGIDEGVPVNWTDTAIINQLFLPLREHAFSNVKQIDTRKLIYKGIAVYPDTAAWNKLKLWDMDTYCQSYFRHPQYDNYPVVGVSWEQAKLYADWRSDRLNEQFLMAQDLLDKPSYFLEMESLEKQLQKENMDYKLFPGFRLPTEAEWIYAAMPKEQKQDLQDKRKEYCFDAVQPTTENQDFKANTVLCGYNANYGPVWDQHGLQLKAYGDDGAIACTIVKSYQPNSYGLYDMAGNVAEWVLDIAQCHFPYGITERSDYGKFVDLCALFDTVYLSNLMTHDQYLRSLFFKRYHKSAGKRMPIRSKSFKLDTNGMNNESTVSQNKAGLYNWWKERDSVLHLYAQDKHPYYRKNDEKILKEQYAQLKACYEHDKAVYLDAKNQRVVKGGSWADPIVYLNPGTKTIKSQRASSARIGFRLAMDIWPDRE